MDIEIKKEGNEKYLTIKNIKVTETEHQMQMLLNNNIRGLLPLKVKNINNNVEVFYEITSLLPLNKVFERNLMRKDDLIKFVMCIKQLVDTLKEYLLCGDNLVLDYEYIFCKKTQGTYYFCYSPVEVEDFELQIKTLFNQMLDYVNHKDRDAVTLAYGLQEITSHDDFSIEELVDFTVEKKEQNMPNLEEKAELNFEDEYEEEYEEELSFWDKLKERLTFHKKAEALDSIYIEETQNTEEFSFNTENLTDEDATVLLTSGMDPSVRLRSVNASPEILIEVNEFPFVIGKSRRSSNYRVDSEVVSRVHARINNELGEFTIEDLNSTNGTFLNEEKIKPHEIKKILVGDTIKLADLEFIVE